MADYAFITTWKFQAPLGRVRAAIRDFSSCPQWYPSIVAVPLVRKGEDDTGKGTIQRLHMKTKLPYSLAWNWRRYVGTRPE